jgi:biotin carboxylase
LCSAPIRQPISRAYHEAARGAQTMKWARLEADGIDLGPDGLVVESFLDGSEHMIEAVVWDGEIHLASLVDRLSTDQATFEYNVHQAPTALSDEHIAMIRQALTAAAAGQGLRRSALHAEIRFHRGQPCVLEVTPRPGGGGLEHMARVSAGYDPIAAHVRIACGRRPEIGEYRPTGIFTAARPLICDSGIVTGITVPREVTTSASLLFCRWTAVTGDVIKGPADGNGILGFIGATGPSRDDAMNAAASLASMISVTVVS